VSNCVSLCVSPNVSLSVCVSPVVSLSQCVCLTQCCVSLFSEREAEFSVLLVLQAPLVRCARRCVD